MALLEETEHGVIGYHTQLSDVLKRVWDLRAEIQEFCERKGNDIPELSDADWMADPDLTLHHKGPFYIS